MRWWSSIIVLTLCASAAFGSTLREKKFSLFSVVQFPNDACVVASNTAFRGTCMSADECSSDNGKADGNCASGFGVCCMFVKNTCGDSVDKNCTYIQNTGFPSILTLAAANTCRFSVKTTIDICQIRLDFQTFVTSIPTADVGTCVTDNFVATGQSGRNPPTVCGSLTGQHMYIETARSTTDTTLVFTGIIAATRQFNVKVQMIECISKWKADHDCTQWFTGASGVGMKSYNFGATGDMLQSQDFATCIRREEGYCAIDYVQSSDVTTDPFALNSAAADGSIQIATCVNSYIQIPATTPFTGANRGGDRFCDGSLITYEAGTGGSAVRGTSPTFVFRTWSGALDQVAGVTGYNLDYKQVPCGSV
jgi:hypothetical protein